MKNPKYKLGDIVEADTLIKHLVIVDFWWEEYHVDYKKGAWFYRLGFPTKSGKVDKRQNFRCFAESRLSLIKSDANL